MDLKLGDDKSSVRKFIIMGFEPTTPILEFRHLSNWATSPATLVTKYLYMKLTARNVKYTSHKNAL